MGMHGPGSNRRGARPLVGRLFAVCLLAACSSTAPEATAPDTTSVARPAARTAGEPVDDQARAAVDPSAVQRPAVVHVLGTLALLPESPAAIPQQVTPLQDDLVSLITLGCAPGTDGCTSDRIDALAAADVEVVNVASAAVGSTDADQVGAAVASLGAAGIEVTGWGENRASAVEPVRIAAAGQTIALHAISLAEDGLERSAHATESTAGIAGPDAFAELLVAMAASQSAGDRVVVAVDWGDAERRSPDGEIVDLATALVRAGADAVVGSGSEFLNRLEVIEGAPVAFDLGQAATATDDALRRDTAVLRVVFNGDADAACLLPATASATGPSLDSTDEPVCNR